MRLNIFYGSKQLGDCVNETLQLNTENIPFPQWATKEIYLSAFFYLTKRFGSCTANFDDCKTAGSWQFEVKKYLIRITFRSTDLEIVVFGNKSVSKTIHERFVRKAYIKNHDEILPLHPNPDKEEYKRLEAFYQTFCEKENVENWTDEIGLKFFDAANNYNNEILNINKTRIEELNNRFGSEYKNSYTNHALKTLKQFLQNMLTPIRIRDVPYNITGECSHDDGHKNNIKIKFIPSIKT